MRHIQFLRNLGQLRFSGQLVWTDPAGQQWTVYLAQGRILYAVGGSHPVRRWRRHVALHCPRMATHRVTWYFDLANAPSADVTPAWDYTLLNLWVSRREITREQAAKIICSTVVDVLFDIAQSPTATEQIKQENLASANWVSIEIETAIAAVEQQYQDWHSTKLDRYSPNQAPIIRQPDLLQQRSPAVYHNLSKWLNGQHTLHELAVQMKREVVEVAASLLPFIQVGWIELINIADLPVPMLRRNTPKAAPPPPTPPVSQGALIACVDDSPLVHHMMEKLLTSAGYQFLGVDDGLRAIGVLLARKPDLIFLDLMMPNASGYEICEQLRKISHFRKTPIVILTGSDGFANRLRSNFAGASDFLSKPLDAEAVLNVIRKHLAQGAAPLSVVNDR